MRVKLLWAGVATVSGLFLSACAAPKKEAAVSPCPQEVSRAPEDSAAKAQMRTEITEAMTPMLTAFEEAVSTHDKSKILQFLDEEYKYKEYTRLYQGHRDQFLNDFFCGPVPKGDQIFCLVFDDISSITRKSIEIDGDSISVGYTLKSSEREIRTKLKINPKKTVTYGILGSRGITQVE